MPACIATEASEVRPEVQSWHSRIPATQPVAVCRLQASPPTRPAGWSCTCAAAVAAPDQQQAVPQAVKAEQRCLWRSLLQLGKRAVH